uniref:PPPDE domain-containing protein n=1 Tax=Chromera velia CCMP2878 TaxID=1169474 RepID=A0A0G4GE87_9ALVE|mmetsp:Transcript_53158/g.104064  ORF Transcript_53158/g.104064 Transcript_53158/m.104064 type:complete len:260 (+) Transcript_53158:320-1099(+)|eukprot:Cvel_4588.t1-p1 / transcript=Cvel_4588.t1 / gene=Cvel_4588 / organism=Chromera_velia_CCMP2878 / gene_product=hypothetical protein / transcript_product=hypothetical protein / location=Cvel_scaffold201:110593-113406(-) / protein_length=259 / sequence_SO=supercontig / SO=protein_coding / is_pseudo=false
MGREIVEDGFPTFAAAMRMVPVDGTAQVRLSLSVYHCYSNCLCKVHNCLWGWTGLGLWHIALRFSNIQVGVDHEVFYGCCDGVRFLRAAQGVNHQYAYDSPLNSEASSEQAVVPLNSVLSTVQALVAEGFTEAKYENQYRNCLHFIEELTDRLGCPLPCKFKGTLRVADGQCCCKASRKDPLTAAPSSQQLQPLVSARGLPYGAQPGGAYPHVTPRGVPQTAGTAYPYALYEQPYYYSSVGAHGYAGQGAYNNINLALP